jgi:hypothetical protein
LRVLWAALLLGVVLPAGPADAQIGTVFTYQGAIRSDGAPYVGTCDIRLSLWTDPIAGSQIGLPWQFSTQTDDEGRFTVSPDFGFVLSSPTWLKIEVRTPHDPTEALPFTTLDPRQPINPAPMARSAESANTAATATVALVANNALNLNGQPPSFYLNAGSLSSGTLNSARLSGSYTNALTLSNASNSLSGIGTGLTALNASNLASGTVPDARLTGTYSAALTLSNAANAFSGSGAGLSALNASNLASGTVPSARLSGVYSSAITLSSVSNAFTGSGVGLTGLNASNIASGTLGDSRLSGNVPLLGTANAFTSTHTFSTSVGIRTPTPGAALHVNDNTDVTGTGGGSLIVGLSTSTNLRMDGNELQALNNGAVASLSLQASGGNLAVGSGTPTHKLYVNGDARVTGDLQVDGGITIPTQTRYLWLGPESFTAPVNTVQWDLVVITSGISYLRCPTNAFNNFAERSANVMLPDGAVVTELRFWVADQATNQNAICQLIRIDSGSFGPVIPTRMAQATSSGDSGDPLMAAPSYADTSVTAATINNATYRYRLHLQATTVAVGNYYFYGARIAYTIASPLP